MVWPPLVSGLHTDEVPDLDWLALFTTPAEDRPRLPTRHRRQLLARTRSLLDLGTSTEPHTRLRRRWRFCELLLFLAEALNLPARGGAGRRLDPIVPAIELALDAARLVASDEAARACRLTVDVFSRRFEDLMGLSFAKFALRHRLGQAARALAETDLSTLAIARQWGFTDESHLHRLFVQHYGCTPGAYRRRAK